MLSVLLPPVFSTPIVISPNECCDAICSYTTTNATTFHALKEP